MFYLIHFFYSFTKSICNYNISGASYSVKNYELSAFQNICINASILPLYLIFYDVPSDVNIFHYKQVDQSGGQELIFCAKRRDMPYAIRSLDVNSSYTIQTTENNNVTIGVVAVATCLDGIVVLEGANTSLTFSNSRSDEFNLAPGDNKCLLVMNDLETVIKTSLSLVPNVDFLYFYESTYFPQQFTSNVNATFNKRNGDNPFLFRIVVSPKLLADRRVSFNIQSMEEMEKHEIAYGKYKISQPTTMPKPFELIINDYSISTGLIIFLVLSSFLLLILLTYSLIRYKWLFKNCKSKDTKYLPPSSFF